MNDTNSTFGDVTFTTSDTDDVTFDTMNNITYTVPLPCCQHTAPSTTSTITLSPPVIEEEYKDIVINGMSLKEFMETVNDRLSILTPKPELLEKYDALKEAYEHYKILEKLCTDDTTQETKR